jgi:general secretion pathway protein A
MYLHHYGFRDKPFKLTHDPAYYYGEAHQVALNELCYSIEERHGLAILLGEPGTGKTTLLLRLLRTFTRQLNGVFLSDVAVGESSLIRQVARSLLVPCRPQESTETVSQYLDIFLRGQVTAGRTVVVLIDEAQGLTDGQFEELRHLTNLEHKNKKLSRSSTGLPSRAEVPDSRPGIAEPAGGGALLGGADEPRHTRSYIGHRLDVVSAPNPDMFTLDAVQGFTTPPGVVPLINIVCDARFVGYVEEVRCSGLRRSVPGRPDLKPVPTAATIKRRERWGSRGASCSAWRRSSMPS